MLSIHRNDTGRFDGTVSELARRPENLSEARPDRWRFSFGGRVSLYRELNEARGQAGGDAILSLLDDMRKELILPGRDI